MHVRTSPGNRSQDDCSRTVERAVAAPAALVLRVVRRLGGRAGGRSPRPSRRASAASTSAARSRSGASPRSPPVPSARRRWAAVSVAFAGGSPTVTAGPADACWGRSACPGRILARRAPVGPPSSSRARTGHVPRSLEPRGRPCWRQAHRSVSGAWIASGSTPTARSSPSSSARSPERERSRSRLSCARSATIPAVSVRRARVPVPRWRERPHPAGTSAQRRPHAL